MRTIRRDGWTAADYDSEQILRELGHRDAAARVNQARRRRPIRRAWRTLRARLRRRATNAMPTAGIDWVAARAAADAVNRGDTGEADRIVQATADPRGTAFAAFRFIGVE
ncbi:hypothetical protein ACFXGT_10955 [Streptomyces sp. NPDC059352]|uniref:hypothetical protein n=1 Tax=Streptomyces sp. NPDC059352 TaxID=3346810 RepID=UPI00369C8BAB